MTFTIGQRWISNTESQLGLGIITDVNGRQVHISFPAAKESRIYAIKDAPLSRIIYKKDEEIRTHDQKIWMVASSQEHQGFILYVCHDENGNECQITELDLDCNITLNSPKQRLFSGLLDKLDAFQLRIETLNHASLLQQSKIRGLVGSRTNHLAHQIYIAHEVAKRYAPRVLLADEVGLGKTIEAGMIIHYQLHTARAQRVLIVVPDNLIHQWLVELIRKFNLYFSIIDEQHYIKEQQFDLEDEGEESALQGNPFEAEQLVLCGLDFLMGHAKAKEDILACTWDLFLVDEAHHLHWSEQSPSEEYLLIEQLSNKTKGMLLLTATPEQVGIESHFARLRLLDPSRFYDFTKFIQEERHYKKLNDLVQTLLEHKDKKDTELLDAQLIKQVTPYLGKNLPQSISLCIRALLDQHGTGRILFRNTRAAIKGFPQRQLHSYPLELPAIYASLSASTDMPYFCPEIILEQDLWIKNDPRVRWLTDTISEIYPEKILIICARRETAIALEQYLKITARIRTALFHENMSIVERDRSAAYFTEEENGAHVLLCSEIGSEGRNFQCAHHLVLFDLPLNPDLLEQRIGRLDRIGQKNTIQIHVPYLLGSSQETLFRWYHEGVNAFKASCSIGYSIYERFKEKLHQLLLSKDTQDLETLIKETKNYTETMLLSLQEGRDRLLELNSCNPEIAQELIKSIETEENGLKLQHYMAKIFHEYGVEHEHHSDSTEILHPGPHMKTGYFPGLKEDGVTITYSRAKALAREDMEFLSWEHPMVTEAMEMILHSETGNACLATIAIKSIAPGTLFVEAFYTVNCAAPKELQLDQYLPLKPMRIVMNVSGKDLSEILSFDQLHALCKPVKRHLGYPIMKEISEDVERILSQSNQKADGLLKESCQKALGQLTQEMNDEANRLEALQQVNPAIRDEEIEFFKQRIEKSAQYIHSATLKIQAIRVIINASQ